MGTNFDEGVNAAAVRESQTRLAQIVPGDDPSKIIDALKPCLGVAAGLLMVVNGQTMSMTHTALQIPQQLFEGWMHTQPESFQHSLLPAVRSSPGDFWNDRDERLGKARSNMEVLHLLDKFGLGEGAGLKIVRQPIQGGGEEHVLMALLTQRGERFPRQAELICRKIVPALHDAICRLQVPFTVGRSIHAQVHEESAVGFVCLGDDGGIIELNQRAFDLGLRYREAAGVVGGRFSMQDFVKRFQEPTGSDGRTWHLTRPNRPGILQVRKLLMPKERFMLSRNLPMLKLEEWNVSPIEQTDFFSLLGPLTQQERLILQRLLTTGQAPKEIAYGLAIKVTTVRKHIENAYKYLGIHSVGELIALLLRPRN